MLRKFIQCTNVKERLVMLNGENASAWSSEELNAAMEIVGATAVNGSDAEKIQAIREALQLNAKKALSDEYVSRAREVADTIQESLQEGQLENSAEMFIERMQLLYGAVLSSGMGKC